jgi:hypothetical protein
VDWAGLLSEEDGTMDPVELETAHATEGAGVGGGNVGGRAPEAGTLFDALSLAGTSISSWRRHLEVLGDVDRYQR